MKKVSILGVGWLGEALFKKLILSEKHEVAGSSRNDEKRQTLEQFASNHGRRSRLYPISVPGNLLFESAFWDCETLVITLPPGRRREQVADKYLAEIDRVVAIASQRNIQHLIYTSSTGVYGNQEGIVTETTDLAPITESAKAVANVEARLMEAGMVVTILRLAGLFGPDRHPGRWFASKSVIPKADAPVNLVHQADVVQALQLAIERPANESTIYNVCAAAHPSKGDFYQRAIRDFGSQPPELSSGGAGGKRVNSKKIRAELGWKPLHDVLSTFN